MTPHEFLSAKMALFSKWAGRETSGWRDAEQNEKVGGVTHSAHQFFLAVDFAPEPLERNPDFEDEARRLGIRAAWEQDHYHLQPWTWEKG